MLFRSRGRQDSQSLSDADWLPRSINVCIVCRVKMVYLKKCFVFYFYYIYSAHKTHKKEIRFMEGRRMRVAVAVGARCPGGGDEVACCSCGQAAFFVFSLGVDLARNWPPHHRLRRSFPSRGSWKAFALFQTMLERASMACSQLRKLPLEGKLSALPTDEV